MSKKLSGSWVHKVCSVDGCSVKTYARGWCHRHYVRWWRRGGPTIGVDHDGAPARFLESTFTHFEDTCIVWPFARSPQGYALARYGNGTRIASRIVCERFNGTPPTPKHDAAHSCGNGHLGCINGYHLRWATRKENEVDKLAHGTRIVGEHHKNARLTERDVVAMRAMARTLSYRELGDKFGISIAQAWRIINGQRWKHVV